MYSRKNWECWFNFFCTSLPCALWLPWASIFSTRQSNSFAVCWVFAVCLLAWHAVCQEVAVCYFCWHTAKGTFAVCPCLRTRQTFWHTANWGSSIVDQVNCAYTNMTRMQYWCAKVLIIFLRFHYEHGLVAKVRSEEHRNQTPIWRTWPHS